MAKKSFKVNYLEIKDKNFTNSYFEKLNKIIHKRNIKQVSFYEIEDLSFANKLIKNLNLINYFGLILKFNLF